MIQNYKDGTETERTFETESISSLAPRIWELIPSDIKNANSLGIFNE